MPKPYKRKIMRKFRIVEISGVDVPAQEGATALIMKRDDQAAKAGLVEALTGVTDGHQHGISVRCWDGKVEIYVDYAQAEGEDAGHSHAIIVEDGAYRISENSGHTHEIDSATIAAVIVGTVSKKEDSDMTEQEAAALKAENERLAKEAKDTASEVARLGKVLALKADARAYHDALPEDARPAFLAKDAATQAREIAEAEARKAGENPVVYTTKAGVEIRKADGAGALALAKSLDETQEKLTAVQGENAALKKAREVAEFEKRAEVELPHLPGTVAHRAALLKAAEGIEDEDARAAAVAALKAQSAGLAPALRVVGSGSGAEILTAGNDPQCELDELTKKHQEANAGMSYAAAQAAVLKTAEGAQLYTKMLAMESQGAGAQAAG